MWYCHTLQDTGSVIVKLWQSPFSWWISVRRILFRLGCGGFSRRNLSWADYRRAVTLVQMLQVELIWRRGANMVQMLQVVASCLQFSLGSMGIKTRTECCEMWQLISPEPGQSSVQGLFLWCYVWKYYDYTQPTHSQVTGWLKTLLWTKYIADTSTPV